MFQGACCMTCARACKQCCRIDWWGSVMAETSSILGRSTSIEEDPFINTTESSLYICRCSSTILATQLHANSGPLDSCDSSVHNSRVITPRATQNQHTIQNWLHAPPQTSWMGAHARMPVVTAAAKTICTVVPAMMRHKIHSHSKQTRI